MNRLNFRGWSFCCFYIQKTVSKSLHTRDNTHTCICVETNLWDGSVHPHLHCRMCVHLYAVTEKKNNYQFTSGALSHKIPELAANIWSSLLSCWSCTAAAARSSEFLPSFFTDPQLSACRPFKYTVQVFFTQAESPRQQSYLRFMGGRGFHIVISACLATILLSCLWCCWVKRNHPAEVCSFFTINI